MDRDHPPIVTIQGEFVKLSLDRDGMIITTEDKLISLNREEASEFGSLYAMAVTAINAGAVQMMHDESHHNPFANPNNPFEEED